MERSDSTLDELINRAKADPALREIQQKYAGSGIESWVTEEEQALLFAVGAYSTGEGSIVEIGSFQGGSACFLAGGLAHRGRGRLTCIDPFLGAPPWLGAAPHQRTLEIFRKGTAHCGLKDWIDIRIGDSPAVAAVWPGTPVDAVFIDGDHSFLGALRDFECWAPKMNPGGLLLIDNADDAGVPEVRELAKLVKSLGSFTYLGSLGKYGNMIFRREAMPAWEMLDELSAACAAKGVYRPWDLSPLHRVDLPPHYLKSKDWSNSQLDEAYQLGFLGRSGPGEYGYTPASDPSDRAVLRAISKDRGDGALVELGGVSGKIRTLLRQQSPRCRVVLCGPEEVKTYAPMLLPGGVLLTRIQANDPETAIHTLNRCFDTTGLKGGVLNNSLLFGIWEPHLLNPETVVDRAMNVSRRFRNAS